MFIVIDKEASKAFLIQTDVSDRDIFVEVILANYKKATINHREVYVNDRYKGYVEELVTIKKLFKLLHKNHIPYVEIPFIPINTSPPPTLYTTLSADTWSIVNNV